MATTCKRCGNTDPSHFAPHALRTKRMICKTCMKAKRLQIRGDMHHNTARRILFNLKQKCRYQKRPEGTLWTIADVERLYQQYLHTKDHVTQADPSAETPTEPPAEPPTEPPVEPQTEPPVHTTPHPMDTALRLRVVPIDKTKPMTVDNAKIIPFGVGVR